MAKLVLFASFGSFREAAEEAKELAQKLGEASSLRRSGHLWQVLVTPDVIAEMTTLSALSYADDDFDPHEDDSWAALDAEEERNAEIREELSMDGDSWGRSEESGWFYDDDD